MDPDTFFNNPCPVPPSVHQTEQQRQADVAAMRDRVMTPPDDLKQVRAAVAAGSIKGVRLRDHLGRPARGWGWWIMATALYLFAILCGYALGMRDTERRYADVPNPEGLEQRVTAAEKYLNDQARVLIGQGAEIDAIQEVITEAKP